MPDTRDPQLDDLRRRARRRLVGAIVLALAAAVLVPMLLESDPKPLGEDVAVRIPPVDDGKFVNKAGEKAKGAEPAPAAAKAEPAPAAAKDPAPAAAKDPAPAAAKDPAPAAAKAEPRPEAKPEAPAAPATEAAPSKDAKALASAEQRVLAPSAKPAAAAAPRPAEPPKAESPKAPAPVKAAEPTKAAATTPPPPSASADAAKAGGFSVQLAAFIDDKGANALAARLKKAGYAAYTEPYATSRGTLWRVRVGPFPTREAAEAARGKLKAEGQNGIIAAAK